MCIFLIQLMLAYKQRSNLMKIICKMKNVQSQRDFLNVLIRLNPSLRKTILKQADKKLKRAIVEIVVNVMRGNVKMKKSQKQKLQKYKTILRRVYKRYYNVRNDKIKKTKINNKDIVQVGGALPLLIPLIAGIIGKAALAGAASAGTAYATKKIIESAGG